MFEQSLYEPEIIAPPTGEGDLFHNYEIKTWDLGSRIYKILGISTIFNVIALLVVAQTSLLTMKGCESPLVGGVCQVLDTIYVGTKLFGTDREYVDAVYDKTTIGDDEEVTFVDVTGVAPPLTYPEGYFQVANPVQYQAMLDAQNGITPIPDVNDLAGIPVSPPTFNGGSLIDTPQNLPKANNDIIDGELPTFNGSSGVNQSPPVRVNKNRPGRVTVPSTNTKKPDEDDTAVNSGKDPKKDPKETPLPTPLSDEAASKIEINKKPLTDFADVVAVKWSTKEIDLNQPFLVIMNGVLTEDGKLDREKSKFDAAKQKGDQKMIDTAKLAIEAVGDSGFLTYLKSLGVDKFALTLVQDDTQITAIISSPQKSENEAKTIASGLNGYISLGKTTVENPSDERLLLDGAKVVADGKNLILNFVMPKPVAQEMINRKLKEAQAKKEQQPKPNSIVTGRPVDNTAKQ